VLLGAGDDDDDADDDDADDDDADDDDADDEDACDDDDACDVVVGYLLLLEAVLFFLPPSVTPKIMPKIIKNQK